MNKLMSLLEIETTEIQQAFSKSSIEGRGTPQEIADRREKHLSSFIEKYFPFPNRIAKGNIIDSFGNESPSFDIIMLNPVHPYTISKNTDRPSVILADGVDFVIDSKGDLKDYEEIHRAFYQIRQLKRLRRVYQFRAFSTNYSGEELETLKQIPAILFVSNTYSEIQTLIEKICECIIADAISLREQFDCIIVNSKYAILNYHKYSYSGLNAEREIACFNVENTLAFLLSYLNKLPKSAPSMIEPVLSRYVDWIKLTKGGIFQTYPELNEKLKANNS